MKDLLLKLTLVAFLAATTSAQLTLTDTPWSLLDQGNVPVTIFQENQAAFHSLGVFSLASSILDPTDPAAAPQLPTAWKGLVSIEARDQDGYYEYGEYRMHYSLPLGGIRVSGFQGVNGGRVSGGDPPLESDTLWRFDPSVATVKYVWSPVTGINRTQRSPLTGMPRPPAMVHPDAEYQGTGTVKGIEVDLWTWTSSDGASELYYWMAAGTATPVHWTRLQYQGGSPDPVYQWSWNWVEFSTTAPLEEDFEPRPAQLWQPEFEDDFSAYGNLYARSAGTNNNYGFYAIWDWHYAYTIVSNAGILAWVVPNTPLDEHQVLHGDVNTFWWEFHNKEENTTECQKYHVSDPASAYIPLGMDESHQFTGFFSECGNIGPCEIWFNGNEIWEVAISYPDGDSYYAVLDRLRYTVGTVDYLVDLTWDSTFPTDDKLSIPDGCDPAPAVQGVDPSYDTISRGVESPAKDWRQVLADIAAEYDFGF